MKTVTTQHDLLMRILAVTKNNSLGDKTKVTIINTLIENYKKDRR